jgi:hypothetical protein
MYTGQLVEAVDRVSFSTVCASRDDSFPPERNTTAMGHVIPALTDH